LAVRKSVWDCLIDKRDKHECFRHHRNVTVSRVVAQVLSVLPDCVAVPIGIFLVQILTPIGEHLLVVELVIVRLAPLFNPIVIFHRFEVSFVRLAAGSARVSSSRSSYRYRRSFPQINKGTEVRDHNAILLIPVFWLHTGNN
jgi:hypothetical protein